MNDDTAILAQGKGSSLTSTGDYLNQLNKKLMVGFHYLSGLIFSMWDFELVHSPDYCKLL